MLNCKRLQCQKGLTLVEVLAALVLLGIFFVGFMTVLPQMTNFNAKTEDKLKTMNLAKRELAEWKDRNYILTEFEGADYTDKVVDSKEVKRKQVNKNGYYYEIDFYKKPDLEPSGENGVFLHKLHIKVKRKDANVKPISETYGYIVVEG